MSPPLQANFVRRLMGRWGINVGIYLELQENVAGRLAEHGGADSEREEG